MESAADAPRKILPLGVVLSLTLHVLLAAALLSHIPHDAVRQDPETSIEMPLVNMTMEVVPGEAHAPQPLTLPDLSPPRLDAVVPRPDTLEPAPLQGLPQGDGPPLPQVPATDALPSLPSTALTETASAGVPPGLAEAAAPVVVSTVEAGGSLVASLPDDAVPNLSVPEIAPRNVVTEIPPSADVPDQGPRAAATRDLQPADPQSLAAMGTVLPSLEAGRPLDATPTDTDQGPSTAATPAPAVRPETLAALAPPDLAETERPSVVSAAAVDAFLTRYDGGPCFLATRTGMGTDGVALDVFSPTVERVVALHNAFAAELGVQPDVLGQHVWSGQCGAVDLLRRAHPAEGGSALHVARRRLRPGERLEGDVGRAVGEKAALYWVGETGSMVDLTSNIVWSGSKGTFSVPVARPVSGVLAPEMLLLVSGPDLPPDGVLDVAKIDVTHLTARGVLVLVGPP